MIPIAKPLIEKEEIEAVKKVMESGMIACGSVTTDFENQFAAYVGCKYGVATTSGTTALEVAFRALGIGEGDLVLTTPFSFIASTNSIIYAGAEPVFADIEDSTFNIDPDAIRKALKDNKKIKALLIVHLFGRPCNMDEVMKIVNDYDLLLIEDCAQAHGAVWNGKKVGSFGHASAFSFYPTKNMTTSEGGIVLMNDKHVADKARLLINHGMEVRYHHDIIGYNYRMTNINASIGLCQLQKLDKFNAARISNARFYAEHINNNKIKLPEMSDSESIVHVFHQYTIKVDADLRDSFIKHLEENSIGYGIFYPISIPEQKCYNNKFDPSKFTVTDSIKREVVSIPIHPQLTLNDLEFITETINSF